MPRKDSADAVKDWARTHIDEIEDVSRGVIAEDGADYPVSAAVTTCWFPDKSYGDVTFPAGNYEALRLRSVRPKATTGGACFIRDCALWIP